MLQEAFSGQNTFCLLCVHFPLGENIDMRLTTAISENGT